jgi:hypothetical protein
MKKQSPEEQTTSFPPLSNFNSNNSNNSATSTSSTWIKLSSPEILIIKVIDQRFYEGHLTLFNVTSNYIIFHFKNEKHSFVITPHIYYIKPNNKITINIKHFVNLEKDSNLLNIHKTATQIELTVILIKDKNVVVEYVNDCKYFLNKHDLYKQ